MKIGLVRHHKVILEFPKKRLLSKPEVLKWFQMYESSPVEKKHIDLLGVNWQSCYSSTSLRAIITAKDIHTGRITEVPELRELDILHLLQGKIKLPFLVWAILVRAKSLSFNKEVDAFRKGIAHFTNELIHKSDGNVLIVAHWFVIRIIQKELLRNGFVGKAAKSPDYGKVYVFDRTPGNPCR